jgi:Reverse transcriptase (RNA-dependent DNA polymerase)
VLNEVPQEMTENYSAINGLEDRPKSPIVHRCTSNESVEQADTISPSGDKVLSPVVLVDDLRSVASKTPADGPQDALCPRDDLQLSDAAQVKCSAKPHGGLRSPSDDVSIAIPSVNAALNPSRARNLDARSISDRSEIAIGPALDGTEIVADRKGGADQDLGQLTALPSLSDSDGEVTSDSALEHELDTTMIRRGGFAEDSLGRKRLLAPHDNTRPSSPRHKRHRVFLHCYTANRSGVWCIPVYLVNTARKRTVVVDVKDGATVPEFQVAMKKEIESFRNLRCIEDVPLTKLASNANLISTRWVLTVKTREDGTKRYKARLVARGFEDVERNSVTRDSPTASSGAQRLVLQALVEHQWLPTSWDFETAFLQGNALRRDVYLKPPLEYATPGSCWRLCKPVYGLVSAPKAWYDRLCEVVTKHGFTADLSDEAIFRLRDGSGNLIGILAVHVDDTIGGGTDTFYGLMDEVAKDLKLGSVERNNFHYKGLRIATVYQHDQNEREFEITVDGDEYLDCLVPMVVPRGDADSALMASSAVDFMSVVGCINYVASAFRPDVSVDASFLGRAFARPTVRHARKANATLEWIKQNRYALRFRKGAAQLTAFCDSAGPNEESTQGGRLFALTDMDGHRVSGWIYWESRKVKRVCRSTLTGEVLSLGEAYDTAVWLRQLCFELLGVLLPIRIVVDSMGLMKNMLTTKLTAEKRLRIDLAVARQGLRRGEFIMTWVPSRSNLADSLTKESASDQTRLRPCDYMKKPLLDSLRSGSTNLKGIRQETKTQADVSRY